VLVSLILQSSYNGANNMKKNKLTAEDIYTPKGRLSNGITFSEALEVITSVNKLKKTKKCQKNN